MLLRHFGVEWKVDEFRDLLFGDYLTQGDVRPYRLCPDATHVEHMMENHLAVWETCTRANSYVFALIIGVLIFIAGLQ